MLLISFSKGLNNRAKQVINKIIMYLEISSVAAALGKNPYESREKTLLISWARHCPKTTKEYLIKHECISQLKENEQTFTELQKKHIMNYNQQNLM